MAPTPSKGTEILSGTPEDIITIKSAEDFKSKLKIYSLPEGKLKEYFDKPIETTLPKLAELRKQYLAGNPDFTILKSFLEDSRNKVLETAKQGIREVQQVAGNISSSINYEKQGNLEHTQTAEKAEAGIDAVLGLGKKTGGELSEKAKTLGTQAKGVIKKGVEAVETGGFLVMLEKAKENGGFFGFFAGILLGILKMIGVGKKVEDLKEKLSSEEIEKTKEEIKKVLVKYFPGKNDYINKVLNNPKILTESKISLFYEKIKSGKEITLNDLINDFKELEINKLLTEKIEENKEKLYSSIQKEIELKYNKTLDNEQIVSLGKLISKHLTLDNTNIESIEQRIVNDNQIQLKDIIPLLAQSGKNTIGFMFGLVSNNIISVSDLAMNFAKKGGEIISISLGALGLSEKIDIEDLYGSLSEMDEKEKAILIGLIYRKGGLFLNIIGSISSVTSKLLLETILPTNSGVDGIKLGIDSLMHGNLKQVENFGKIEKALGLTQTNNSGTAFLNESISNLKEVKNNFTILEAMKESNGNIDDFYKKITDIESKTGSSLNIKKYLSFDELKTGISSDFAKSYASKRSLDIRNLKSAGLGFGANSAIQNFNLKLENIAKNQSRIALGRLNLAPFKKLTDAIDISKVSKLGDSLLFELRSKDDAKAFLKQANELAKKSPSLIKGIFDKLPIIAIGGLAAAGEKPFFESLKNEMPYLIPLIGPVLMVADSGVDWSNFPPKFIKPEQTAIAGALLTMDGFFLLKEKGLINKGKYLIKPIKDIYDIGKGTVEIGQRLYKTGKVLENGKTMKNVLQNAITKTKALKGKAKAIAIIALLGYGATELAFADDEIPLFDTYIENGKLNIENIKADSETLSKNEKLELIKILFIEESGEDIVENLEFNLESKNTVSIISNSDKIQGDWFITNELKETLNHLFGIEQYNFNYNQKPA